MSVNKKLLSEQGEFRVNNLFTLARYLLEQAPTAFSMQHFRQKAEEKDPASRVFGHTFAKLPECGTVSCAVGYGPSAGIEPKVRESWENYAARTLISIYRPGGWDAWTWCFAAFWVSVNDTPEGAAIRILYLLKHGATQCDYSFGHLRTAKQVQVYQDCKAELLAFAAENGFPVQESEHVGK